MSNYLPPRGFAGSIQISDVNNPLPPLRGTGYLAGTITDDGAPVVANVRALWRPPGGIMLESVIAGSVASAPDGTWQISDINPTLEYTVVAGMAGRNDVLTINVTPRNPPRFSARALTVPIGVALDYALPVIAGEGAVTVALDSGTLPSGVTYAAGKLTASHPTGAVDDYPVVFTLTDDNETVTDTLTIDLILLPLTIHATTAVPAILVVGDAMTPVTFAAAGGEGPYTYAVATGALPTGTSIDSATGVWDGTPSGGGGFDFSIKATDIRSTVETTESYHVVIAEPHKFWRVNITASNNHCSTNELIFASSIAGAQTAIGGTIISGGDWPNSNNYKVHAFDGVVADDVHTWSSNVSGSGWIGYEFATKVVVAEVSIYPRGAPNQSFKTFDIQYSDDGVIWTTVKAVSNVTSWDYSGHTPNIYSGW